MNFMDFIVNQQYGNVNNIQISSYIYNTNYKYYFLQFLVHCHAGTGRTGLAIAAWLIYGLGYTAEKAIK